MYENRQEIKDVCELIQNSGTKILKKDARINFAYKYWNITDKDLTELYEILIKSHFERKPKSITILGDFMDEQKITNYRTFGADMKYRTLENTLKTLRSMINPKGRIINVFSTCGDNYETRIRRIELGTIANKYSDIPILTDDSPRTEDPQKIRDEVLKYCPNAIEIKTGRKDAIKKAMELSSSDDVILIAGKGHEDYVTIGKENIPYTDQSAALDLIQEGF